MDKITLLLGIVFFIGFLILFISFIYSSDSDIKYYNFINEPLEISQSYENTVFLTNIVKDRKSLVAPGHGYGLSITWNMKIPNTAGEKLWHSIFAKDKPIIRIGDSPQIYYNPKYNELRVIVKYKESPFYAHYPIIELKNIPLQRWNNYAVVIHDNYVKIYLNKQLVINKKLPNIPEISNSDIIVGEQNNNIIGTISNLRLYFRPYDNNNIKKILN